MDRSVPAFVRWSPRALGILFAMLLSVFALDVFQEGQGLGRTLVALAMHLVPSFVVLLAVVLGWRFPLGGAVAFGALGVAYVLWTGGRFPVMTYVVIAGPLLAVAALFFADWAGLRARPAAKEPA